MTRNDAFKQLCNRMNSPANKERYDQWKSHPSKRKGDCLIEMHIKHILDFEEELKDELPAEDRRFIERSYDAALKALEGLLNKHNWK